MNVKPAVNWQEGTFVSVPVPKMLQLQLEAFLLASPGWERIIRSHGIEPGDVRLPQFEQLAYVRELEDAPASPNEGTAS